MRVAICDDELNFLQELSLLLKVYNDESGCSIEYKTFTNPLELVEQIEKGIHYDVVFLDICMPGINGVQCAKDIRMYDNFVKIIFLTSSTEYAVESYSVKAYDYILKPVQREKLFPVLRQIERETKKKEQNIYVLKSPKGIIKISLAKLKYCEVINRKMVFHMSNGEKYECGLRMNELEERLMAVGCFVRPHRSFLVNMDFIQILSIHGIIMENGDKIPVPREKYATVKQAYMDYVYGEKDCVLLGE